jgi:hypothetical protein
MVQQLGPPISQSGYYPFGHSWYWYASSQDLLTPDTSGRDQLALVVVTSEKAERYYLLLSGTHRRSPLMQVTLEEGVGGRKRWFYTESFRQCLIPLSSDPVL